MPSVFNMGVRIVSVRNDLLIFACLCLLIQDYHMVADVDAYVLVYSTTDRTSFQHVVETLYAMTPEERDDKAVIIVANKTDLVRTRQVTAKGETPFQAITGATSATAAIAVVVIGVGGGSGRRWRQHQGSSIE